MLRKVFLVVAALTFGLESAGCRSETTSPNRTSDIRKLGAVGDGITNDTAAIQHAIDTAGDGGVVVIPAGQYVCGAIQLRSNLTIRIEAGATILGSTLSDDYRASQNPLTDDERMAEATAAVAKSKANASESLHYGIFEATDLHDITITGTGTIDGRGALLEKNIHELQVAKKLPGNPKGRPDEALRPLLIRITHCKNVTVENITLRDSACWVQNYTDCENLTLRNLTVRSQAFWNNDGIDVTGGHGTRISNCDIDSADDGICLKSTDTACDDVEITNCRVRSWANAIKFGTASFTGFQHVKVDNIQVIGSGHAGLAIESTDGGAIDDIHVSNLQMKNLRAPIVIKLGARTKPDGRFGSVKNIMLENISAEIDPGNPDAGSKFPAPQLGGPHNHFPIVISGLPDHALQNISLKNITLTTPGGNGNPAPTIPLYDLQKIPENEKHYPEYNMHGELPAYGVFARHVDGLTIDGLNVICVTPDPRSAFVGIDLKNCTISNLITTNTAFIPAMFALEDAHTIHISNSNTTGTFSKFVYPILDCTDITADK